VRQAATEFRIRTQGKGLYEFTAAVEEWVRGQRLATGLLTLFCRHTSASLLVQENADPDVRTDLLAWMERLAPENDARYTHTLEGPDDMPAHLRSAVTQVQLTIPLMAGRLTLGTWQGIYLFEHRRQAHTRTVAGHLLGE
jgi:secondary thiamine-phosphate synthase enzyme